MTVADLVFAPWNDLVDSILMTGPDQDEFAGFPNVKAWHERITGRSTWKRAMETRAKLLDDQGLLPNGMPKGVSNMAEYVAKVSTGEGAAAQE
jgi:glutathione S-transferase